MEVVKTELTSQPPTKLREILFISSQFQDLNWLLFFTVGVKMPLRCESSFIIKQEVNEWGSSSQKQTKLLLDLRKKSLRNVS